MRMKIVGLILLGAIASTSAVAVSAAPQTPMPQPWSTRGSTMKVSTTGACSAFWDCSDSFRAKRAKSTFARRPKV